jgi:hypothetical protein
LKILVVPTENGCCPHEIQKLTNTCGGSHSPVIAKVRLPAYITVTNICLHYIDNEAYFFAEVIRGNHFAPTPVKRITEVQFFVYLFHDMSDAVWMILANWCDWGGNGHRGTYSLHLQG